MSENDLARELTEVRTEFREYRIQMGDRLNRLESSIKASDEKIDRSLALMEKMETESLVDVGIQQQVEKKRKEDDEAVEKKRKLAEAKRARLGWWAAGFIGALDFIHTFWDGISKFLHRLFLGT